MAQRVIRIAQLATTKDKPGLLPVSPATIWRWARDPQSGFPKPFRLGAGTTVFDAAQVEAFIAKQQAVA